MAKIFNGLESGKIYEDLYPQGGTQQIVVEDDFITITIHFPELRRDNSWRSEWCTKTIIKGSFIYKGNTFDYLNSTVSELSLMGFQIQQDGSITEYGYGYKYNDVVGSSLPSELTDETAEYVTFSYGSDESIDWTKGGPDTDAPKLAAFPVSNNRAVVERSGFGDFVPKGWIDSPFTTSLNDVVQGTSSKDTLKGGLGADTLFGNEGNDFLSGGTHKDKIYGGRGNDILDGGLGNDLLVGGNGKDTAVFSSKNNRINLSSSRRQNTGDGRDILRSIENVDGGGGNDFITGNKLIQCGEDGNDRLGEAGNDRLNGGTGNDRLSGGNNNDRLLVSGKRSFNWWGWE